MLMCQAELELKAEKEALKKAEKEAKKAAAAARKASVQTKMMRLKLLMSFFNLRTVTF